MKKRYLKRLQYRLFFKYLVITGLLCIGGVGILYMFDDVLNGFIIDFLQLFSTDPFNALRRFLAVFLPIIVGIACFAMVYFLCKDLISYMRILVDGIDDIMQKERSHIRFPKDMKKTEELLLQIAREYQNHHDAALADEEKKKDLIYLLAQDIKMPLAKILMYLEFLEREHRITMDIKKDYIVEVLHRSLDLEDMINEFFDITRFNLQYAKWNPESMYLDRMMEQMADEFYSIMEERQMRVKLQMGTHLKLYADSQKIAKVIRDLLRNLVKLGDRGAVINIKVVEEEQHYDIEMKVSGKHYSAYQIAHIFHNYYRLQELNGSEKVHVLGLGIAKQIMDMHKGTIRASSIGKELYFYLHLPKKNEGYDLEESVL